MTNNQIANLLMVILGVMFFVLFILIAIFIFNFSLCISYAQGNNIITNKDIENLKRNSNNGNIPKAKKKNTPIKITPKQEVKQPNITEIKPKEKIETNEPLVNIKNDGTSIQITVKGADPEQDTENNEEPVFIARALLPEGIDEGTKLKSEFLQYENV